MATIDYEVMIEAADDWGPDTDEDRRWFLAGWRDEADGFQGANKPKGDHVSNIAEWCAYNSGIVAAREAARGLVH